MAAVSPLRAPSAGKAAAKMLLSEPDELTTNA